MDGRTNTRTRGTKSRGRERRPRRKEGRKEREKIKDKRQLTSVTWPLCWLLFLLCAFWESNSATGQLTDPCRFRLSDSPLPLFSSLSLTPSNFLSASLMASLLPSPPLLLPLPSSLSLSLPFWRTIGLIQYEELEANQTLLHKWVRRGGRRDAKGIEIDWRSMSECQSRSASYCIGNESRFNKGTALLGSVGE